MSIMEEGRILISKTLIKKLKRGDVCIRNENNKSINFQMLDNS
jgi:hypothetical protein